MDYFVKLAIQTISKLSTINVYSINLNEYSKLQIKSLLYFANRGFWHVDYCMNSQSKMTFTQIDTFLKGYDVLICILLLHPNLYKLYIKCVPHMNIVCSDIKTIITDNPNLDADIQAKVNLYKYNTAVPNKSFNRMLKKMLCLHPYIDKTYDLICKIADTEDIDHKSLYKHVHCITLCCQRECMENPPFPLTASPNLYWANPDKMCTFYIGCVKILTLLKKNKKLSLREFKKAIDDIYCELNAMYDLNPEQPLKSKIKKAIDF